jgi:hypothetical protein
MLTGYLLGRFCRDLTFEQTLWVLLLVMIAKLIVDGSLWELIKLLYQLLVYTCTNLMNEYSSRRLQRSLVKYKNSLEQSQKCLQKSMLRLTELNIKLSNEKIELMRDKLNNIDKKLTNTISDIDSNISNHKNFYS